MRQLFVATAGVALLSLSLAARDAQGPAAAAPRARAAVPGTRSAAGQGPRRPRRAPAAPSPMVAAEQTRIVTSYCGTCHSERGKAGGLSLASFDAMKAHEQPEVIEKMIRKLRAGMMPPPGAKRPDAAQIDQLAGSARGADGRVRRQQPQSGLAAVPAPDARRVLAGGQGPARSRGRRHPVPAGRHPGPRLRQHRRSAGLQPGAARRLPARRLAGQPPGDRRQAGVGDVGDLPRAAGRVADALRRGHAARLARRHRRGPQLPGRRRLQVHVAAAAHDQRRAVRQHRHRHGRQQRAARDLGQRRTRRGARGRRRA